MILVSSLGITKTGTFAQTNVSESIIIGKNQDLNVPSDTYFQDVPAPEGPNTPLLPEGPKKSILSDPDKYVYLNIVATKQMEINRFIPPNTPSQKPGKVNPFEAAILLDKNFKELPKQDSYKISRTIQQGETLFILAIPKDAEIVQGVKTVKEYYYRLINRDRVAKETQYEFNKMVSYGTSKETAMMIGKTLGLEFGLNGLSSIPLMASVNYMSQSAETWGTTITDETTISKRFDLGRSDAAYNHPHYWLGMYQAVIDYSIQSTTQLETVLSQVNIPGSAVRFELPKKETYKLDILHPVRTKGTGAFISPENR
ncbi:hypothetical protein [Bacillus toyonensis]|uniref:Uncharacterized protein n=1 Tax=Bacillus toyonensis TaxID=155322 RepID=A0A2A8HI91_9BACI|nr:hypothetical protein [Bacillus toyonensis]PEQ08698.1 hypothetical protein CN585_07890 [Bacillus toyonensis]